MSTINTVLDASGPAAPAAPAALKKYGEQYPKTMVGKIESIANPIVRGIAFFFYALFNVVFVLLPLLFDHIINGAESPTSAVTTDRAAALVSGSVPPSPATDRAAARTAALVSGSVPPSPATDRAAAYAADADAYVDAVAAARTAAAAAARAAYAAAADDADDADIAYEAAFHDVYDPAHDAARAAYAAAYAAADLLVRVK